MDDEHMRIRGADIVLNDEAFARPRRRRAEARMAESQAARSIQAAHKRFDPALFQRPKPMHARPGHDFNSRLRLEPVERLVYIHDQKVLAVIAARASGSNAANRGLRQHIAFHPRCSRSQAFEAFGELFPFFTVCDPDRHRHRIDVGIKPREQRPRAWNSESAAVQSVRVSYGCRENRLIEPGGAPFRVERMRWRGGVLRVRGRLLQQRHAHLRPVIGSKSSRQQLGKQDLRLSEMLDNLNLGGHERAHIGSGCIYGGARALSLRQINDAYKHASATLSP